MSSPASGDERALVFSCKGDELAGVLHPAAAAGEARGALVIVGGPQYRAGSHRQFVLLARDLAAAGFPALRFDYRGMGDSEGAPRDFRDVGADIRAAADAFFTAVPSLREIVLWGLCDAASAAAFYGSGDDRVTGLVLLNPWVRTETGEARSRIRHYYRERLADPAFWRKAVTLHWNPLRSLAEVARALARGRSRRGAKASRAPTLPERVFDGLASFQGRVLLILSGNDLTAREFEDTARTTPAWQSWLESPGVEVAHVPEADHTFSRRDWRDRVSALTAAWLARA